MWDRFRPTALSQRGGRPEIDNDDSMSESHWHTRGVSGGNKAYSYSIRAGPAPQRPPRPADFAELFKETQQPPRPRDASISSRPPKQLDVLRSSQYRPPSSIYSQHSPLQSHFVPVASVNIQHVRKQRIADDNDVSPPSSPEALAPRDGRSHQSPDISPIDYVPDMSQLDSKNGRPRPEPRTHSGQGSHGRSNIPMIRRERRRHQGQSASNSNETKPRDRLREESPSNRQHHDPRWDPMTGELTSSNLGKPSQVKPAEFVQGIGLPSSPKSPKSPKTAASFGDRVRRKLPGRQPDSFDSRPAWNGASGRAAVVSPVQDEVDVAPLRIPPKSTKRMARLGSASPPVSPETGRYATPISKKPDEKTSRGGARPASPVTETSAQAYPSPPNSGDPLNAQSGPDNAGTRPGAASGVDIDASSPPRHRQLFHRAQQQLKSHQNHQQQPHDASASLSSPPITSEKARQASSSAQEKESLSAAVDHSGQQKLAAPPRHAPHTSWSSSVYSTATTAVPPPAPHPLPPLPSANPAVSNARAAEKSNAAGSDPVASPSSRLSATTYTPSTIETLRPPPQDANPPPMPTAPQHFPSVLDRSRPKVRGDPFNAKLPMTAVAEPIVISLKSPAFIVSPTKSGPLGSNPVLRPSRSRTWDNEGKDGREGILAGVLGSITRATSTSPTAAFPTAAVFSSAFKEKRLSSSSTNKDLPPAPPEMEGTNNGDRVAVLNAKLGALGNRRININKSIKQMTELMPADNLMASAAVLIKREDEKKKVEALRQELADVQRQEYELGLKLHRAYKRMDREANYESTSLWVRRATHD